MSQKVHDILEDKYGLSPMQLGILFHTLYDRQAGLYIEQVIFDFPGQDLNVAAFQQSWERVVARHPSLRTSFHWEALDAPVQHVHASVALPFEVEDWRTLDKSEQKWRLDAYLRSDRKRGFTLAEPPLTRVAVFRTGETDYQCVWTIHHLLVDMRSAVLILREVFALADAISKGEAIELPPRRPYRDHIDWLERQDPRAAETFWRKALRGFTAPTPFVVDRPAAGTYEGPPSEQEISLRPGTSAALRALGKRHQVTLNTFFHAAWALLLSRYSGEEDVLFGSTRACRRSTVEDADTIVGVFLNTVPVRTRVVPDISLVEWLQELRSHETAVREYEHTSLTDVQRWSQVPSGTPLFQSVLDFGIYSLNAVLHGRDRWKTGSVQYREKTNFALTVYAQAEPDLRLKIAYDRRRFDDDTIGRMLGHLQTLLEGMAADLDRRVKDLPLLSDSETRQLVVDWNDTRADYPRDSCVHQLFEAQTIRTPEAPAMCFEDQQLTYRELNARANQLARYLGNVGVRPDTRVGICMERSLDMMVGLLGILKAGAAYVPLDPSYPKERLAFILEDAGIEVLVTQERLAGMFGARRATECGAQRALRQAQGVLSPSKDDSRDGVCAICVDADWPVIGRECDENLETQVSCDGLAYLMYTSGSTGKPKGVMVRHRNVVNFFAGMDCRVGDTPTGVWLAVTSISFDISVLELFWPLTRGFKVVLQSGEEITAPAATCPLVPQNAHRPVDFSLFYFASSEDAGSKDKYRLLLEGARFADTHGFTAVWTPERHFHQFGGLYPNPSVTGAAIAAVTERTQIRAGSVVLPLQSPIRVAEEWAVVDNISGGRVGVSFASGWHANDFVFAPENYADRKAITFREIETVRRLWRGETLPVRNGAGHEIQVRIYPQPVQRELPVWLTAAGDPETFRAAGEMGANLLTHLLGHTVEALAEKIAVYRKAWRDHGHGGPDGAEGHVTLMLHTFVGENIDVVRETVRQPLMNYLKTSSDLVRQLSASMQDDRGLNQLSEAERQTLHNHAFERFFQTSGLLGTPETCLAMIERLRGIGVDEVACLIDFGVDAEAVLAGLELLCRVRDVSQTPPATVRDFSIPAQIARHGVTHLQCTPSMARMLAMSPESLRALKPLRKLLVGGEALPDTLADTLSDVVSGDVLNMYGPTETTVWSTTAPVQPGERPVPIGRPIANTQTYVLDRCLCPVPIGVPGELFIAGDGVAAGYHNRPELTTEKFIGDPFSTEPGRFLYRTGDLARCLPDGNLEFLGRADDQVKIRGHRIELGEIEAVLQQYPGVREAVVVAREDQPGDQRLVGYVVSGPKDELTAGELRGYLKAKLPKEMLPAAFVMLDALPRTPNGKLNRRALPAPDQVRLEAARTFVAPRDAVETELARMWEKILGVRPIGVADNFFELGGHSLLAVSLFAQIEQTFGKNFPLATLFQGPTIEELAKIVQQDERPTSWSPLVSIQPHGSRPPLFFMHSEGGNVLEYYPLARSLGPDQPFYALQSVLLNGHRSPGRPDTGGGDPGPSAIPTLEDLAARYVDEMRSVQPAGPYYVGGFCFGGYLTYEVARQLRAQGEEVALLAMIQTAAADYPKFPPGVTFLHRRFYRLIKRLDLEWSNVKALEPKARLPHLVGRAKRALTIAQVKAEAFVDPWLARFNRTAWHSLAYSLEAIGKLHVQGALSYAFRACPVERVTLFRAGKQPLGIVPDQTLGWDGLMNGHLEIHHIPGAHHQNILKDPAVRLLAQQLTACVDRARHESGGRRGLERKAS
jgi:natural product biosynthesis luciferase-like monooxygenase protein